MRDGLPHGGVVEEERLGHAALPGDGLEIDRDTRVLRLGRSSAERAEERMATSLGEMAPGREGRVFRGAPPARQ